MNTNRLISFAAALVITATEWAGFSSLPLHAHALYAPAAQVAGAELDPALPVIVVTAHRL